MQSSRQDAEVLTKKFATKAANLRKQKAPDYAEISRKIREDTEKAKVECIEHDKLDRSI